MAINGAAGCVRISAMPDESDLFLILMWQGIAYLLDVFYGGDPLKS
jgi:hypothetical protein